MAFQIIAPAKDEETSKASLFSRIAFRLPVVMVGLAVVASVVTAAIGYIQAQQALTEASREKLELIAETRRDALRLQLVNIKSEVASLTSSSAMDTVSQELLATVNEMLEEDRTEVLSYYQNAELTAAQRLQLTGEEDKSFYSWRHSKVHSDFASSVVSNGFADILIIDKDQTVIYSAAKYGDFLQSLKEDTLSGTELAQVYAQLENAEAGTTVYSQMSEYGPAGNAPSMFIAQPIYKNTFKGVEWFGILAVRLDAEFFDTVLADRENLGQTGQTYLVNESGTVLSNKPLAGEQTALRHSLDSALLSDFAEQFDGVNFSRAASFVDRNGQFNLGVSLNISEFPALIVAETDVDEALASVNSLAKGFLIMVLAVIAVSTGIGYFSAHRLSNPLRRLSSNLRTMAQGDLGVEIVSARRKDEIGDIGRAVASFQANLIRAKELDEQQAREQQEREERVLRVDELNENFDVGVRQILTTVSDAGGNLESTAKSMATISEQTNTEAQTVSSASEQSLMNLQAVAGAAEELSATVGEIDREVRRSADVSKQAAEKAAAAEVSVNGLMEAAQRIGEVVSLINDIADQTNLLALNATIEAARAGEAGKGFAVVASEVKGLANQTGQATGEISVQIQSVQAETEKAVAAIKEISTVIADVNQATTAIASAVEEQAVTATDISSNIQQVTSGSSEVAQAITRVSMIAGDAGQEAENVLSSAQQLTTQSDELKAMVEQYLENIRAA